MGQQSQLNLVVLLFLVIALTLLAVFMALLFSALMRRRRRRPASDSRGDGRPEEPLPDPWKVAGERARPYEEE